MRVTRDNLAELLGKDPSTEDGINLSAREITHVGDLSHLTALHRLNLSANRLASGESLSGLAQMRELTWLNLSKNQLSSLEFVRDMTRLSGRLNFKGCVRVRSTYSFIIYAFHSRVLSTRIPTFPQL